MKVLVNPTILINEPKQNKSYGYSIILDKKNTNCLTIKYRCVKRSRGIAGYIYKDGEIKIFEHRVPNLHSKITSNVKERIDLLLDLVYGNTRNKMCTLNSKGLIEFKK